TASDAPGGCASRGARGSAAGGVCGGRSDVAPGSSDFRVRHSNLPFREGARLDVPPLDAAALERCASFPAQRAGARWHVESWFVRGEPGGVRAV
ncbi:MAG TPA: hypothetical protein VEC18_01405, partial [Myxococcota bacterium]|nr:hypothetical protein [Myxococcota bacterium]